MYPGHELTKPIALLLTLDRLLVFFSDHFGKIRAEGPR
jgi:hypothetical protein